MNLKLALVGFRIFHSPDLSLSVDCHSRRLGVERDRADTVYYLPRRALEDGAFVSSLSGVSSH